MFLESIDLWKRPTWSNKRLRKLGEALVKGEVPPSSCPTYDEVMFWHNDVAAEVAATLAVAEWQTAPADSFDIAARSKTVDTLLEKLRREKSSLTLDQVQDIAGVRIDVDLNIDQQTALADEIVAYFGPDVASLRDIRQTPHSGYRAVHVWLRLPAARVEIQVRTLVQSAWANAYESLGDKYGRGIRYNEVHPDPSVQGIVEQLHVLAEAAAEFEQIEVEAPRTLERVLKLTEDNDTEDLRSLRELAQKNNARVGKMKKDFIDRLAQIKVLIESLEV